MFVAATLRLRDRNVPRKPRPARGGMGGVKGHNTNDNTLPGSPALMGGELHFLSGGGIR